MDSGATSLVGTTVAALRREESGDASHDILLLWLVLVGVVRALLLVAEAIGSRRVRLARAHSSTQQLPLWQRV
jgi:hypothetical protein